MRIQILNQNTIVSHGRVQAVTAGLQIQIDRDFAPAYGITAKLTATKEDNGDIPIYLVDEVPDAPPGALAWHTVDDKNRPFGILPIKLIMAEEGIIGPTLSHELTELLADPDIVKTAITMFRGERHEIAYEVADPVEADTYTITTKHGDIRVSNFVLPSWFNSTAQGPYDYMELLKAPLTLTAGGYMQYLENGQWKQIQAEDSHNHPFTRISRGRS